MDEIQGAVKAAIQQCCVQLKAKISRQLAAREQKQRKRNLTKYIPNVAAAVHGCLQTMAGDGDGGERSAAHIAGAVQCVPAARAGQAARIPHRQDVKREEGGGEPRPNAATPLPLHAGPKRRRIESELGVLGMLRGGDLTEAVLAARLADHVERIDTDMVRAGLGRAGLG